MPVRSLHSSVLKWPDLKTVDRAIRRWADHAARMREGIVRIGYFGSYAQGAWGVGSDLDIVVVVEETGWQTERLPVPVDLLVFTEEEWGRIATRGRFGRVLGKDAIWIYERS